MQDKSIKRFRIGGISKDRYENHWTKLITAVTTPRAPINLNFYGANAFH